ncbi:hypothetical protein ACJ41O_005313 [Fusarium nematophilum]
MKLPSVAAAITALSLMGAASASRCMPDPRSSSSAAVDGSTTTDSSAATGVSTATGSSSAAESLTSTELPTTLSTATSVSAATETSTSADVSSTAVSSTATGTTTSAALSTTTVFSSTESTTTAPATTTTTTTSAAPKVCPVYTNYVGNPSFDNRNGSGQYTTQPWTLFYDPAIESTGSRTGQRSVMMQYPYTGGGSSSIFQRVQGTQQGKQYYLKFYWALAQGSPHAADSCNIGMFAGTGQDWKYIRVEDGVQYGQYYEHTLRFSANEDNQRINIGFWCALAFNGPVVKVKFDDVAVYDNLNDPNCPIP